MGKSITRQCFKGNVYVVYHSSVWFYVFYVDAIDMRTWNWQYTYYGAPLMYRGQEALNGKLFMWTSEFVCFANSRLTIVHTQISMAIKLMIISESLNVKIKKVLSPTSCNNKKKL